MIIIIILLMFTSWLTTCVLFHQSPVLIILYHACSCLISLTISLPTPVCMCSRHDFQCMFMIQIYRYTCTYPYTPLDIQHTTRWRVLTPLDLHVQILELGAFEFSRLLIKDAQLKRESSADRLRPYPFKPLARLSSFPL